MCVGVVAWQADTRWLLLAAANRDEFHDRPSASLSRWARDNRIIAGQDLTAGGTWLGVTDQGRFAFVTNHKVDGQRPARESRGGLVTDWLSGIEPTATERLNPFNSIMIDGTDQALFLGNEPAPVRRVLPPGVHGLSNGPVDEPWPKTARLDNALRNFLAEASGEPEQLFAALRDESLPDGPHPAGGPSFPAIFVNNSHYGTRCSTIVAIAASGQGWIEERLFDAGGKEAGRTTIPFSWPI